MHYIPGINLKAGTTQNNKADIISVLLEFNSKGSQRVDK